MPLPLVARGRRAAPHARRRTAYIAVFIFLALYLGYFTKLPHKELRYSLAFLPMALAAAGGGIAWAAERIGGRRLAILVLAFCVCFGSYSAVRIGKEAVRSDQVYDEVGRSLSAYAARSGRTPVLLSSAPFPAAVSDARIAATMYDDWREVLAKYEATRETVTHVLIDTCTLETVCRLDAGCTEGREAALAAIRGESRIVADGAAGSCRVTLYERI